MIQILFALGGILAVTSATIAALCIGVYLIYTLVTSFFIYVKPLHAAVVHNFSTSRRRALHEGIHRIKFGECLIPIDWKWKEEGGHVFHFNDNQVPTDTYLLKTEYICVRTRCDTVLNIRGQVGCRIVDPARATCHSQPMHYMLVQFTSVAITTIYRYTCDELYAKKAAIQEEIVKELTKHIEDRGIVCTEFIISSILPAYST